MLQGVYCQHFMIKKQIQRSQALGHAHRASRRQSCMLKPHLFVSKVHTLSFAPLCLNKLKGFPNIYNEKSQQFKEMFKEK